MSTVANDTFTEASDVTLASHSGELGGWVQDGLSGSTAKVVASTDKVAGDSGTATSHYRNTATPSVADYYVQATLALSTQASTARAGLVIRQTEDDCYFVQMAGEDSLGSTQYVKLFKLIGPSTVTQLGSTYNLSYTYGSQSNVFKLDATGSTLTVYIDGVSRISATDSTLSAAGAGGLRVRSNGTIDNFSIVDTSSGNTVAPSSGTVSYTGATPTIGQQLSVLPSSGQVIWAGATPTITQGAQLTISSNSERMNFDAANTIITNATSSTPSVALRIHGYLNESYGGGTTERYSFFYGEIGGANGKTPTFTLPNTQIDTSGGYRFYPLRTGFAPYFSVDGGSTWTAFANSAASGNNWQFSHTSAFTSDSVLISFYKPYRLSDFSSALTSWKAAHNDRVHYTTSGSGTFTVATAENYTNDDGAQTGQAFLAAKITDDASSPSGGKRNFVVFLGMHPDEDVGHWVGHHAVDWLVTSSDAKAVALREFFNVYVYYTNPNGKTGGGLSGSFDADHPTYNANRRWLDTPDVLDIQAKLKPVIATDTGGIIHAFHDFHSAPNMDTSAPSADIGYYDAPDSETDWVSAYDAYLTKLSSYASITRLGDIGSTGATNSYFWLGGFSCSMSTNLEIAQEKAFTTAQLQNYGQYVFKAYSDLIADDYWPATVVQPSVGSAIWAGTTPSINQPISVAPSAGSVVWEGAAPEISQTAGIRPTGGAIVWAGTTPVISQPRTVGPSVGAYAYAGAIPGISQEAVITTLTDADLAAIWAYEIEPGTSALAVLRVLLAGIGGKRVGLGTATEQYMAQDGTTPRITFSPTDTYGNGTPAIDGS